MTRHLSFETLALTSALLAGLGGSLAGTAAAQHALVFVPEGDCTTRGGLRPLDLLSDETLVEVVPGPGTVVASKTMSLATLNALLGDEDLDLDFFESPFDEIDALALPPQYVPTRWGSPSLYDFVWSGQHDFGEAFPALISDGSLWRLRKAPAPGGPVVEVVLDHALLQVALGTTGSVDIDAVAFTAAGDLLLSFRDDELIHGDLVALGDGAVVAFAADDIDWNADGTIADLGDDTVQIVLAELDVDALVVAAGLLDDLGAPVVAIGDLQALDVDPAGGTFLGNDGVTAWPHLLFAGSSNGPRVLTTAGGGSIATLNGVALGDEASATGSYLGLDGNGSDLAALQVIPARDLPLCVDLAGQGLTPTDLDDTLWVGNGVPNVTIWIYVAVGPYAAGANFDAIKLADKFRFQSLYAWNYFLLVSVPLDANGDAELDFSLDPADLLGDLNLVVQVAQIVKPVEMSAPVVITYDQ